MMEIVNERQLFVVDISEVVEKFNALPKDLRRPSSVISEALTDVETSDMEIEGLIDLIAVRHYYLDPTLEYCDSFAEAYLENVGAAVAEEVVGDLGHYTDCLTALAEDLGRCLNEVGFYGRNGYLKGDFFKIIDHHLLVLESGVEVE